MRVLVVHAHPVETSFNRSLYEAVLRTLQGQGHEVDALDLYAENFEAVLSREERLCYHDIPDNVTPKIRPYVERLQKAGAIVFVYPVWNYGFPAILKGFFDRIFVPGVSFDLRNGRLVPTLTNIRKVAIVTTYGGNRWRSWLMGDPPRRIARRMMWVTFRTLMPPKYLALYDMNNNREPELAGFIRRVEGALSQF